MKFKQLIFILLDCIWPTLEPRKKKETSDSDTIEFLNTTDVKVLKEAVGRLGVAITTESDRNKLVEGKLQSVLGFNAVAMTVLTAMVSFLTSTSVCDDIPIWSVRAVSLIAGYIALQILRAIWAAIRGLERREYLELTADTIVPTTEDENLRTYFLRIGNEMSDCLATNTFVIDDKVSQMAIAHRAIKNAIFAMFLLLVALVISLAFEDTAFGLIDIISRSLK